MQSNSPENASFSVLLWASSFLLPADLIESWGAVGILLLPGLAVLPEKTQRRDKLEPLQLIICSWGEGMQSFPGLLPLGIICGS